MSATRERRNRLADETSAYLLQHAGNPVDWHPWGEAALERARREDRPLLVSIGYSSCHWCHVMERESFEDEATAALMNRHFVCVKVDREERPDVDQIYMETVVRLTGHGGWPLTVFCRPDGSPFYGGTYFPDLPRHGMPSFRQVLEAIAQAWSGRRDEVDDAAARIVEALQQRLEGEARGRPGLESVRRGAQLLMRSADLQRGGFGSGPKFPTPTNLELLLCALDFLEADEAGAAFAHLSASCREMARRGLFDHLAGGFHRYCVDVAWTIPHFEKMLYDQGLLLSVYAELLRRGGEASELEWPIRETVACLRRELRSPEGGFYASQDADAEGVEGAYHVWTPAQLEAVLGERAADFARAYGVEAGGNFEHGTSHLIDVLRAPRDRFEEERAALLAARRERPAPETDRKRVAAWNGYAITGLARAGSVLGDAEMLADAREALDFVLDRMIDDQGRLHRVFNMGRASVPAFLDDHAALLEASLEVYRAAADERALLAALHLGDEIVERFFDAEAGELYFTATDGEALVHRPRSDSDGATPAAAGLAALGLLRLGQLSGASRLEQCAERVISGAALEIERAPHALPTLLRAVALQARGLSLALVAGDPEAPETRALAARARRVLLPDDIVVVRSTSAPAPRGVAGSWLAGREPEPGRATAWVCRGTRCSLPVTSPEALVPL